MNNTVFHTPSGASLAFSEVVDFIKRFLEGDEEAQYKLTIGSDSEVKKDEAGNTFLELISAIVIYRKGYGGKYSWRKKRIKNVKTLREKIYQEVLLSVETAQLLVPELRSQLNGSAPLYDLEIHIDVGERGETREMIKEVVGIVKGYGFVAKTKPESYAASNIADRHA